MLNTSLLLSCISSIGLSCFTDVLKSTVSKCYESIKWKNVFKTSKNNLIMSLEGDKEKIDLINSILDNQMLDTLSNDYSSPKDIKLIESLNERLLLIFNQNNQDKDTNMVLAHRYIEAILENLRNNYPNVYNNILVYDSMNRIDSKLDAILKSNSRTKISACSLWEIDSLIKNRNKYGIDLDFFDYGYFETDRNIIIELKKERFIYVKADNQEECLYYLLRLLKNSLDLCDNVLIITDVETWNMVDEIFEDKILVPVFDADNIIPARHSKTIIILPYTNHYYNDRCININSRTKSNLVEKLKLYIRDFDFINNLLKNKVISFSSLVNNLFEGKICKPIWFTNENKKLLVPALLLGKWSDRENRNDRVFLEILSNYKYDDYITLVCSNTYNKDAFISTTIHYGEVYYYVNDLKTAWNVLFDWISEADVKCFCDYFKEITLDQNSRIEHGIKLENCGKFSSELKNAMVISFVYLNILTENILQQTNYRYLNRCLDELFSHITNNCEWRTITEILPNLIESNPEYIIGILENEFSNSQSKIHCIFENVSNGIFSYPSYPSLLCALEKTLFYDATKIRTIKLLQILCNEPIYDKNENSPLNTLSKVFSPIFSEIGLDINSRKILLSDFMDSDEENCWKLLKKILPRRLNCTYEELKKPYYRTVNYIGVPLTEKETKDIYCTYLNLAFKCAGRDLLKWDYILQYTNFIYHGFLNAFVTHTSELVGDASISDVDKFTLSISIRNFLYNCRYNKDNFYNDDVATCIEENIYKRIRYYNQIYYDLYCFELHYKPLEPQNYIDKNYEFMAQWEINERLQEIEQVKILSSYMEDSTKNIQELFYLVKDNQQIGISLAKALNYTIDIDLIKAIKNADKQTILYLYIFTIISKLETNDAIETINKYFSDLDIEIRFLALKSLKISSATLTFIASLSDEEKKHYWKNINLYVKDENPELVQKCFNELIKAQNFYGLNFIIYNNELTTQNYVDLLLNYVEFKNSGGAFSFSDYDVETIFKRIYKTKVEVPDLIESICQLEIYFSDVFCYSYDNLKPKYIINKLAYDPKFCADIIKKIYPLDNSKEQDYTPEEINKIRFYSRIFHYIKFCPCVDSQDNYNDVTFTKWVSDFVSATAENNQKKQGLNCLGKFLANFPKGKFDGWLPDNMCEIISNYNNEYLNDAFYYQCLNNQGSHFCNEGKENNSLIEEYNKYADVLKIRYPIVASIFLKLSRNYDREKQERQLEASGG